MIYVLADGLVTLKEAAALIACYFLYVMFMFYNQQIMDCVSNACGETPGSKLDEEKEDEEEDNDDESPIAKAVARPLNIIFEVTIPDCGKPANKDKYLLTFFTSIVWIGVLSYFMVTWASKL